MMSATAIFSLLATPKPASASNAARVPRQASPRILSSFPTTRWTSAMAANISGWVCAAQPVTTIRRSGRSRFSRRIDCRACATASLVTAQLLMTMVSARPALSASRAITSDSKALRRQPKVTTSTLISGAIIFIRPREQRRIEAAFILERRRPRHQHVVIPLAPFDGPFAARQRYLHDAIGALQPRRGHRGGAGRRAAGPGQPRAALPGADRDMVAINDVRQRDVGALRKDRVVFQQRSEAGKIVGVDVVDPEDRMRIAHVDHRRRVQHRRVDRADLQLDRAGVAKLLRQRNILPAEFRRAHVDGVEIGCWPLPAIQQAGPGLEGDGSLTGLLEQLAHHATHAVAAGTYFRAIIVVDADEGFGALKARRLQHHH